MGAHSVSNELLWRQTSGIEPAVHGSHPAKRNRHRTGTEVGRIQVYTAGFTGERLTGVPSTP